MGSLTLYTGDPTSHNYEYIMFKFFAVEELKMTSAKCILFPNAYARRGKGFKKTSQKNTLIFALMSKNKYIQ